MLYKVEFCHIFIKLYIAVISEDIESFGWHELVSGESSEWFVLQKTKLSIGKVLV